MSASKDREPALVIPPRPMVTVERNEYAEVIISTSFISDDMETVEHASVSIPMEDLEPVVRALQQLLAER